MSLHIIPRALGALALLSGIALGQGTNRVTFEVCCGQGIIDQDHDVTMTLEGPNGATLTVSRPAYATSSSEDIAGGFAGELTSEGVTCTTSENSIGKENSQAEDLILPSDWKVKEIKIEKNGQADDGHLKAHHGVKGNGQQPTAPIGTGGIIPLGWIDEFHIELFQFSGTDIEYELHLSGWDSAGRMQHVHFSTATVATSPGGPVLYYKLQSVGNFLDNLGMTVIYPGPNSLHVLVPPGITLSKLSFSATQNEAVSNTPYTVAFAVEEGAP